MKPYIWLWLVELFEASSQKSRILTPSQQLRRLAPKSRLSTCNVRVYSTRSNRPSLINSTGTCPEGTGERAFLVDSGTGSPKLKEIRPQREEIFHCPTNTSCTVAIEGFGLQTGDSLLVTNGGTCGTANVSEIAKFQSHSETISKSVNSFDEWNRPIDKVHTYAVFDLGKSLAEGNYSLCYAPFLGAKSENISDLTLTDYIYDAGTLLVDQSLFKCDFENQYEGCSMSVFRDSYDLDLRWQNGKGGTETPGTGPTGDATTGNGTYIYMDAPGFTPGGAAVILTPPIIASTDSACVEFKYHMYGEDVSTLRVYEKMLASGDKVHLDSESILNRSTADEAFLGVWGKPKWVAVGNKGDEWYSGGFGLTCQKGKPFQLVFEAVAGASEQGDIALDDVVVLPGRCNGTFSKPASRKGQNELICGEVRMRTGKHPEDKAWNLEGAVSCGGRGYSLAQVTDAWLPCCVPGFGNYTLMLRDRMGDGWEGSELEFRFFGRTILIGDELKSSDVQIPFIIGQVHVANATYSNSTIDIYATVNEADSYVWCGMIEAMATGGPRLPAPPQQIMKEYGIRASKPTSQKFETVLLQFKNPEHGPLFISPNKNFDIYCYAEATRPALNGTMTDSEIAATRFRISSDVTPPRITVHTMSAENGEVNVEISTDEPSKVWCAALLETRDNLNASLAWTKKAGVYHEYLTPDEAYNMTFIKLAGGSNYSVHCTAEDLAQPVPNEISVEDFESGLMFSKIANASVPIRFHTPDSVPGMKITKHSVKAEGFDISVTLDAPGTVWCAAAPSHYKYPTIAEVMLYGAKEKSDQDKFVFAREVTLDLEIRGVEPNTIYNVFCAAGTLSETAKSSEPDMWNNAIKITSFGEFCEIPATVDISLKGTGTPFDPITQDEELKIREFITKQKDLDLDGIYRIDLVPNKTASYEFFENPSNGLPDRYARVRAGRCLNNRGFYEQLRVGPLHKPAAQMHWLRLAKPVETACGGYNPEGLFGRRLRELPNDQKFQQLLEESFGFKLASQECMKGLASCLSYGAAVFEVPEKGRALNDESFWVGMKTPAGEAVPFYIRVDAGLIGAENVAAHPQAVTRKLQGIDLWGSATEFWYNGQRYKTVEDLLDAYETKQLNIVTPETLKEKNAARRRLEPHPYAGASGTSGKDMPHGRRSGLEHRLPPEHVEPQGKRYTIETHPGGESFTIEYAGWSFTVTNDRDKSLQIWNLRFKGDQVAFQMGLQDAVAHYTVSERTFFFMDSWYGGLGGAARPVLRGYECPKHGVLVFWDQSLCVWEQDMARPIRSHYRAGEIRDAAGHFSLHIRQMITVSNYDYVTTYEFSSTGHLEMKVEFTGELYAGVEVPWWSTRQEHYGTQVTGAQRFAALHAHLVVWKIDFDLGKDFNDNSVYFQHVVPDPRRMGANYIERQFPAGEVEAAWHINDSRQLAYEVVDEKRNIYGNFGGWRVMPGKSMFPNNPNFELYAGPAAWAKYRAFSTVFDYGELDATLPRDNKFAGDPAVCIDNYINNNQSIRHSDVVTWTSMSFLHIPSAEDYPLTVPIGNTLSTMLRPSNWFYEDPTMDLHNSIGGDYTEVGQCAIVRRTLAESMDVSHANSPVLL